jgi:hypothetical protein
MTEAVKALTRHAFDVWKLNRVEIHVAVGNRRSAAIPNASALSKKEYSDKQSDTVTRSRTSPSIRCSCTTGRATRTNDKPLGQCNVSPPGWLVARCSSDL